MRRYLTVIFLVSSLLMPAVSSAQGNYSNRAEAFLGEVYTSNPLPVLRF